MKKLLLGFTLGALALLGVLKLHVVTDSGGTFVVQKQSLTLDRTYIDSRSLGVMDLLKLPAPVKEELARRKIAVVKGKVEEAGEDLRRRAEEVQSGS